MSYFSALTSPSEVKKRSLIISVATTFMLSAVTVSFVGCASAPTIRSVHYHRAEAVPTYYVVRPGDSLSKIAMRYDLDYHDIARMNQIGNDYIIQVGQRLRLVGGGAYVASAQPVAIAPDQPLSARPLNSSSLNNAPITSSPLPQPRSPSYSNPVTAPLASQASAGYGNAWRWPTDNAILQDFDLRHQIKGIRFTGNAGDPVRAAADGTVIYANNGLPEYGNLILVQHANGYITAYAHNQRLLVQEKAHVTAGQQIAEMGSTGADHVMLEFQVRLNGKPMNPRLVLPQR